MITIKHFGTNGGGFFGANSAHPFENPNAWSDFIDDRQLPALPLRAGVRLRRHAQERLRHAVVIFGVMMSMLVAMIVWSVSYDSLQPNPAFTGTGAPVSYNKGRPEKGH